MSRQSNAILRVLKWATLVVSQLCTAQVCKTFVLSDEVDERGLCCETNITQRLDSGIRP